jgi:phosphoribosylanthranilate isomerase
MASTPRIKICCIASIEEAWLAIRHGASAIGLVSAMPSGPGPIDEATIAQVARAVPPGVATFLLTALTDAEAIVEQHRRCATTTIQLVDEVAPGTHATLRRALPGIGIVQVIHVTGEDAVDAACALAPDVDALLLDSGNPSLAIKELGGTGRAHDWRISRRIVERCGKPVYLAGGLRPGNVAEAVATAQPFGLDLCSGVRTAGRLDPDLLDRFVTAARGATA